MDEKKSTLVEFIKGNKGKIIKGALIVVGVVAGIVIIRKLSSGGDELLDAMDTLSPDGAIMDGFGNLGEVAENVVQ